MSQTTTKVRLVRCPRCRLLLPELPGVSLYKCGGCGTILQAKSSKLEKDQLSSLHKTEAAPNNELKHVPKEKEASSISEKTTVPSTDESSLARSRRREDEESGDCKSEQHEGIKSSADLASSNGLSCQGNEDTSLQANTNTELDQKEKSNEHQSEICDKNRNGEQPRGLNYLDRVSSSSEINYEENQESSLVAGPITEVDEKKNSLELNNGKNHNGFGDSNSECPENATTISNEISSSTHPLHHESIEMNHNGFGDCNENESGGSNFSGEVSCSTYLNSEENEDSSPIGGALIDADESISIETENGSNENELGDICTNRSADMNISEEDSSSIKLAFHENEKRNQIESGCCNGLQPGVSNYSGEVSSSTELNCQESEESSLTAGAHISMDEKKIFFEKENAKDHNELRDSSKVSTGVNVLSEVPSSTELTCHEFEEPSQTAIDDEKSRVIFTNLTSEKSQAAKPRDLIIAAQMQLGQSIPSDDLPSSVNEQLEQSEKILGLSHVSSVDTLNTSNGHSTELHNESIKVWKSPATRSYYTYEDSVSSYDGIDDQLPDQHENLSFSHTQGMNKTASDSQMNRQTRYSSSISSEKKRYDTKESNWDQDEWLEPTTHHHTTRPLPRSPFHSRGSLAGYENGSPLSYGHDGSICSSSFQSPEPKNLEQEKVELLRKVFYLQNELNRLQISKEKANGRFPQGAPREENNMPSYYGNMVHEVNTSHHSNYPRYPGRYSQGQTWSHECKISQRPFSGEISSSGHQVEYSCLHCFPRDLYYSAQLPPHVCCNNLQYTTLPAHSSPQHFLSSEISSWSCDSKSDDQWHKNYEEKKSYLRERNHVKRRHFRPIAGAAPFVACYRCSELLQLPADFLLSQSKYHYLRCSACSEVLKFSLKNRSNIVPYTPSAIALPPSEVDNINNATDTETSTSALLANGRTHADPVSRSDDYGQSFDRSYTAKGEPSSVAPPMDIHERKSYNKKISSRSSFQPIEERKSNHVLKFSGNKDKRPVESSRSAGPSSKMSSVAFSSSEIEELPPKSGSPLHRLMGYTSPSQVLRG